MHITACITTRNRTDNLANCLDFLWSAKIKPNMVIVSDDSPLPEIQEKNRKVVEAFSNTVYLIGPMTGVCANRNNAVRAVSASETDYVTFIDDDVYVDSDFLQKAIKIYENVPYPERKKTILSGVSYSDLSKINSNEHKDTYIPPTRLSFLGYFCASDKPGSVCIHAALFPRLFFDLEEWDENIYFGYEDAELCLRALKNKLIIIHCPDLKVFHAGSGSSSLSTPLIGKLTKYEVNIEAARLYVGIKRYKDLFPNQPKLWAFIIIYFSHMFLYLLKNQSLKAFPTIIRTANIGRLYQQILD